MRTRKFYWADLENYDDETSRKQCTFEQANLIGSDVGNGMHMPVLDIDFPARLIPSSTEGHFHLYFDREITWDQYVLMMNAMVEAGILEEGFVRNSIHRKQSFVRLPHVKKGSP